MTVSRCTRSGHLLVATILLGAAVLAAVSPAGARGPDTFEAKLTASDAESGDFFGSSVALSEDTLVVGSPRDSDGGIGSGSVYVFTRSGTTWSQQVKLTASDAARGDAFGSAVAISGDTLVVGARSDDDGAENAGSAYVFTRSGVAWSQQAKLTASDPGEADVFGVSVSVSGNTLVVGVRLDDDGAENAGSAYVFTRSGTVWTQQQKLTASDAALDNEFGFSVAISGNTIVVGARFEGNAARFAGSAYVFTRDRFRPILGNAPIWVEQSKLEAADRTARDNLGSSVALSGGTVVLGAPDHDDGGEGSGSAYVFVPSKIRLGLGSDWKQQAKLNASDAAADDRFGSSVAISGNMLVVGSPKSSLASPGGAGSVYVFARSGTVWSEQAKLTAPAPTAGDNFGLGTALSGDTVVIGSPFRDVAGSAYVFVDKVVDGDGDGLSNYDERNTYGTDPSKADTDGDGTSDGDEVAAGTDPLAPPPPPPPPAPDPPAVVMSGYWMLEADGTLYEFGDSAAFGPASMAAGVTAVAFDRLAAGDGLWVLDSTGKVHVRGSAKNFGDVLPNDLLAADQVASISVTPSGQGYWVFTDLGQVLNFGDAEHFNDLLGLGIRPNGFIVASAATPSGKGYYMLGSDGGVFAFGDAEFYGSIPQVLPAGALACPIVGLVPTPSGGGYWMVACDGGVFAFGDAQFVGSIPGVLPMGTQLNSPINGLVPYGNGYLMVASDGGVFTFSDLAFLGSLGANPPDTSIVAITAFAS